MRNYPLIVLEGIDGSGKTHQAATLGALLRGPVMKFPDYATDVGHLILRILRGEYGNTTSAEDALILQSLMLTNRWENVDEIIDRLEYAPVIIDRYSYSAFCYGAADGLPQSWLIDIHRRLPEPDYCVILDIPAEVSFQRRPKRTDAYESNRDRLGQVVTNYRLLARAGASPSVEYWQGNSPEPHRPETKFVRIDGTLSKEHTTNAIMTALGCQDWLKHLGPDGTTGDYRPAVMVRNCPYFPDTAPTA